MHRKTLNATLLGVVLAHEPLHGLVGVDLELLLIDYLEDPGYLGGFVDGYVLAHD